MMENNDFNYILMSALKHPYRDHITKESTSLLMKELDQAASYLLQRNQASACNDHLNHLNNHHYGHWDGLTFGSPKSPDNVARTILRALGASREQRNLYSPNTASLNQSSSKQTHFNSRRRSTSSGSIPGPDDIQLTNGHRSYHQVPHLQQHLNNHRSSSILSRCRRRLRLQLTKFNGSGVGSISDPKVPSPRNSRHRRRPSVTLASNQNEFEEEQETPISVSEEGTTPSSIQNSNDCHSKCSNGLGSGDSHSGSAFVIVEHHSNTTSSKGRDEHQLIAYNSSLLMVKPTSPTSPDHRSHGRTQDPIDSCATSESSGDSFAEPPPPAEFSNAVKETAILEEDSPLSEKRPYPHYVDVDTSGSGHILLSAIEHHPPPKTSASQQFISGNNAQEMVTSTSTEPIPSPELGRNSGAELASGGTAAAMSGESSTSITGSSLQRIHNRTCTSYRLKVPLMKNPVDLCLLPNDDLAIADYDNGLLIVNDLGEIIKHKKTYHELNSCGVSCIKGDTFTPTFRIFLLVVRDGVWTVNVYRNYELVETARCPSDAQIENWALRRLVVCVDNRLHLMASGETKSTIWTYEFERAEWRTLITEHSGGRKATSGNYNDMSVKYDKDTKETKIVLCEWKRAQLWTLFLNGKTDLFEEKSIKMKRIKGQEWIVQGPHLAVLDEQADILVYDGSGKLFLFDGDTYRCKKIVADLGRGEVSALASSDGWVYVLYYFGQSFPGVHIAAGKIFQKLTVQPWGRQLMAGQAGQVFVLLAFVHNWYRM